MLDKRHRRLVVARDTVTTLGSRQHLTGVSDHSFSSLVIHLRQHSSSTSVTGISIQDEWLAQVGKRQDRGCDESLMYLPKRCLAISAPLELRSLLCQLVQGLGYCCKIVNETSVIVRQTEELLYTLLAWRLEQANSQPCRSSEDPY